MPKTEDIEIITWVKHKQFLYKEFNLHKISEADYLKQVDDLDQKIKNKTNIILNKMDYDRKEKEEKEHLRRMEKMSEEAKVVVAKAPKVEKVAVVKPAKAPKVKSVSRVSQILDVLQMKSIKNIEAAVDKIVEKNPADANKANIKVQISNIIKQIIAGKRKGYSWDSANFQLTKIQ